MYKKELCPKCKGSGYLRHELTVGELYDSLSPKEQNKLIQIATREFIESITNRLQAEGGKQL